MLQTKNFFFCLHTFSRAYSFAYLIVGHLFSLDPFLGLWGPAGECDPSCTVTAIGGYDTNLPQRGKKDDHAINYWHLRAISLGDLERDACESGTYLIVLATTEGGAAPTGGGAVATAQSPFFCSFVS